MLDFRLNSAGCLIVGRPKTDTRDRQDLVEKSDCFGILQLFDKSESYYNPTCDKTHVPHSVLIVSPSLGLRLNA